MRQNDQTSDNFPAAMAYGVREREHVRSAVSAAPTSTAHPAPEAWARRGADVGTGPARDRAEVGPPDDAIVLADGSRLRLRPIGCADREGMAGLFACLSPASRYRRYLSPKRDLSASELSFLTDVDHVNHEAIAAIDQRDGAIVGVARYVEEPGREGVAEIAVEVADEHQNMGIGTALAQVAVERARANGLLILTATTRRDNWPARSLLRRLRFRPRRSRGLEIELQLAL